jgi:hypothetical protein
MQPMGGEEATHVASSSNSMRLFQSIRSRALRDRKAIARIEIANTARRKGSMRKVYRVDRGRRSSALQVLSILSVLFIVSNLWVLLRDTETRI